MIEVVGVGPSHSRLTGLTVSFHRDHYPSGSQDYELAA